MREKRMQIEAIQTQSLLESRSVAREVKKLSRSRNPKIMVKQGKEAIVVRNPRKAAN